MSSNINWLDNKVISPSSNPPRQTPSRTAFQQPTDKMVSRTTQEHEHSDRMTSRMPQEMDRSDRMTRTDSSMSPMRSETAPRSEIRPRMELPMRTEPLMSDVAQGPPPSTEPGYIPNYLARNIGTLIRAEFIIGNSQYFDRVGRLVEVGFNYFVLDDINFNQLVMCDLYSVRFVTILRG